ncbi:MAG: oligosaccharide flippase family protein [Clostridia bacterium]|nr:oligosaccharide flippase family protein [Clostridia bacterium]
MSQDGRKISVIKNVVAQMFSAVIQTVLGFVARKIFVVYLTAELLGLNGLMTSIIGMLSIAELGVGEAINYSLYKPLANGDKEQVNAIMKLYKKLYLGIAGAIIVIGLAITPFLKVVIGPDVTLPFSYIYKIYFIFLFDTFLSYCLAYSRNIITADQKDYIVTNADSITQIITTIFQIAVLIFTRNYILYLVIKLVIAFGRNIILHFVSIKMHPYIKEKQTKKLSKEYLKELIDNVKALFVTKVSYFIVSGTDNMLLSSFVSITSVAIYANYLTILNLINKTFNTIFDKAKAGVGNFIAQGDNSYLYQLFKNIFFINFIFTSFTTIGIYVVANPVIELWMGKSFLLSGSIVFLLAFNNYSRFILQACECFRGAMGLYSPRPFVKYIALLEGVINLVASLAFIFILEDRILGVFLGTSISTVVSTIAVPWIVYKFLFKRPLHEFFAIYFKYMLIGGIALLLCKVCSMFIYTENQLLNIFIGIILCTVIVGVFYLISFYKTDEFKYVKSLVLGILKPKKV